MKKQDERIHGILDGEITDPEVSVLEEIDAERLSVYREKIRLLEGLEEKAPKDFVIRVMAKLPDSPERHRFGGLRFLWPGRGLWAVPALAGAVGMLLIIAGISFFNELRGEKLVAVHFELFAPSAKKVEMVGTFSGWMPGRIVLKGPDAVGYWESSIKLRPGRYEYLFLIDGVKMVADARAAAKCPDGFGSENSLLLVRDEGSFRRSLFQFANIEEEQMPEVRSEEIVLSLPDGLRGRWETLLDRGAAAGLERTNLERALARLAAAGLSPEKVEAVFGPLFADIKSGEHARQVFLEIEEGILKGVPFEALVGSVFNKNELFLKVISNFQQNKSVDEHEFPAGWHTSVVGVLERGLSDEFVRETVNRGKRFDPEKTKHVMNAVQMLHHAGLDEKELKGFVKTCFEKNLEWNEIDRLVRHILENLKEGVVGKSV